ncbi:RNA polymerase sigma-70 factor [Mucilaginibacter mali]|uniref:RNA polymerase sigma-70 factor n=1 Tax=Mucilaginibacter mali TaxID=2740462 RepID=A0A7D4QTL0_9SPHI|nr:RNA polymerase sigma-70 factor [Mucilaginibacter mali]QKJ30669.1 RNA polymerase sigma-70 factor [Mucilaginibacter mali]
MEKGSPEVIPAEPRLLELAAQGDRDAYASLYQFYLPRLYKYLFGIIRSREDTEEILHDMFLKLWEDRANLARVQSFNSYIFRIAKNKLLNLYKHQQVARKAIDYFTQNASESTDAADERLIYRQYQSVIDAAINSLPPKRRQVYELCTQQELSYDEVADQMGISRSMVKKQIYAAKDHIREYLQMHADISAAILIAAGAIAGTVLK